jgi:tetratricopeptide (TPR) repeat protein
VLGALTAPSATAQETHSHTLGAVQFRVSCAPDVQAEFDRGVALLHHMMYVESRKVFEAIADQHPSCAMGPWGVAMTLFQPLWPARPSGEDLARGAALIRKAREIGPATEREQALLAAAEAFYREPATADWWTRLRRWEEAMGQAHRAQPDDIETAAFYALSHLAAGLTADDRMAYQARAAKILLGIYEREPSHPGAIHYTIHANDVDGRSGESVDVVRSYGDIAPNVPHALHMPTHIFIRLGAWSDVIEWNRRSANAALLVPVGDAVSHHYPHAMDYLVYAYLQQGNDSAARVAIEENLAKGEFQRSFVSAFHLASMPARYAVERRAWTEAAALTPRSPDYLAWDQYPWAEALTWFAQGLGTVHTGDLARAHQAERRMRELRDQAEKAGEQNHARYIEIDRRILVGRMQKAEGNEDHAVALTRSAAELESTVQKDPVTPGGFLPANEALGDLLLEMGQPLEALAAYESSLQTWPRRFNTMLGAARAARESGDASKARRYYADLLDVAAGASTDRAGVLEAKNFVAGTD